MSKEILVVLSELEREKGIPRDVLMEAMKAAVVSASKKQFKLGDNVDADFDSVTGEIKLQARKEVVSEIEDPELQILLEDAVLQKEDITIGDYLILDLNVEGLGRIAASTAKQVISQRLRDAERSKIYGEFIGRVGDLITGSVSQIDKGNIYVDIGRTEAILPRREQIYKEVYKRNDRIRCYILEVREFTKGPQGPQVVLSRTHPGWVVRLFEMEVPEIEDEIIEIKSVSRAPGERSKVVVYSSDIRIDAVWACVGMRGSRVQAVVNELQGEKIDIVSWSEDPAILVAHALSPAETQRVNVDIDAKKLDVILSEENLSKAIGRRGQNVRLATKLINYEINIMTDQEDSEKRQLEFKEKTENFVKNLELDETLGQLLVAEGFSSIDDIKDSKPEAISKIEGIEEETAKELIARAAEFYQKDQEEISNRIKDLGLESELINHKGLTPGMLLTLGEQNILKLSDFADLASDELTGSYDIVKGEKIKIKGCLEDFALSKNEADELIMSARNKIYKDWEMKYGKKKNKINYFWKSQKIN